MVQTVTQAVMKTVTQNATQALMKTVTLNLMKILTQRERLYYVRNANCDANCDARNILLLLHINEMPIVTQKHINLLSYVICKANCDANCDAIIINLLCDTKYDKNIVFSYHCKKVYFKLCCILFVIQKRSYL